MRILAYSLLGAILCAPVTLTAWRERNLPHFGVLVDDGVYWVTAKAVAQGQGYKIPWLPGEPWQTKYPPLYPAYLALAWRVNPQFPANLPVAVFLAWLWAPPLLLLGFYACRKLGLTAFEALVLTALFAVNPHFLYFATGIHTEVPYTVLLLGTLLALERASRTDSLRWPLAAGVLAAAAFLCRSTGIALIASGVLGLWLAGRKRSAWLYLGAALPAVAGWAWWAQVHKYTGNDSALIYHTDYLGFYTQTVSLRDLPVLLWGNLGGILIRGGNLVLPTPGETPPERFFSIVIGILAFRGVLGMVKRVGWSHYHLYAAGHLALLIPWNFPANSRLLFPLAPLLMAGLWEQFRELTVLGLAGLRQRVFGERLAGAAMLGAVVILAAVGAWRWSRPFGDHYPQLSEGFRRQIRGVQRAYAWIRQATPADATFVACQDPRLYLEANRKAASLGVSPVIWFRPTGRTELQDLYLKEIPKLAVTRRRRYVLLTDTEFLIADRQDLARARRRLANEPRLREVYASEDAVIYEVVSSAETAPSCPASAKLLKPR